MAQAGLTSRAFVLRSGGNRFSLLSRIFLTGPDKTAKTLMTKAYELVLFGP